VTDVSIVHPNVFVRCGLTLLYPLSCETRTLQLVQPDNWLGATILVAVAVLVYSMVKVRSDGRVGHAEHER